MNSEIQEPLNIKQIQILGFFFFFFVVDVILEAYGLKYQNQQGETKKPWLKALCRISGTGTRRVELPASQPNLGVSTFQLQLASSYPR